MGNGAIPKVKSMITMGKTVLSRGVTTTRIYKKKEIRKSAKKIPPLAPNWHEEMT
jgi:hypothetical protein